MGQCYSVIVKADLKDEAGAIKALQDKIKREDGNGVNYSIAKYAEIGIGTETFDDLMRIFLAGWNGQEVFIDGNTYTNDFNATYGWQAVLAEMFKEIAPYCNDGSEINIYPDYGSENYVVENGIAVRKHIYMLHIMDAPIECYEEFQTEEECIDFLEKKTGLRKTINAWDKIFNDTDLLVDIFGEEWEDAIVEFDY